MERTLCVVITFQKPKWRILERKDRVSRVVLVASVSHLHRPSIASPPPCVPPRATLFDEKRLRHEGSKKEEEDALTGVNGGGGVLWRRRRRLLYVTPMPRAAAAACPHPSRSPMLFGGTVGNARPSHLLFHSAKLGFGSSSFLFLFLNLRRRSVSPPVVGSPYSVPPLHPQCKLKSERPPPFPLSSPFPSLPVRPYFPPSSQARTIHNPLPPLHCLHVSPTRERRKGPYKRTSIASDPFSFFSHLHFPSVRNYNFFRWAVLQTKALYFGLHKLYF